MSICAGSFLIRIKLYYLCKQWWGWILRTNLWDCPGSRSLGFNCLHCLAYSSPGRSHAARIPPEMLRYHQALPPYSPTSSPSAWGLVLFMPLEGRERKREDGDSVPVFCGGTLLFMPQAFLSLSGVIAGSHLHGKTTHTKHPHTPSHLYNQFVPTPRVQAGQPFFWIWFPANCKPCSFIVNECVN